MTDKAQMAASWQQRCWPVDWLFIPCFSQNKSRYIDDWGKQLMIFKILDADIRYNLHGLVLRSILLSL